MGTVNAGDMIFQTSASGTAGSQINYSNTLALKWNGRVGIGTVDPTDTLQVAGSITGTKFTGLIGSVDNRALVDTPETTGSSGVAFNFKNNATNGLADGGLYNGVMTFRSYGSATDWSGGPSHQLGFTNNGNIYHRFGTSTTWNGWKKIIESDTSGNVGVGVTTPSYKLDVANQMRVGGQGGNDVSILSGGAGYGANLDLYNTSSVLTTKISANNNSYFNFGNVGFGTNNPLTTAHVSGSGILLDNASTDSPNLIFRDSSSAATWNMDSASGAFRIFKEAALNGGSGTVNFQINSTGYVGIGTTAPTVPLEVAGNAGPPLRLKNTASGGGSWQVGPDGSNNFIIYNAAGTGMYIANGTTAWSANSDRRLKKNIETIPDALEKLLQIDGVTYWYKTDKDNDPRRVGVIAQDVKRVLPEAVSEKNGMLAVRYQELIPLTINAIKELHSDSKNQAAEQNQKIMILEEENRRLKNEMRETQQALCEINPNAKICHK